MTPLLYFAIILISASYAALQKFNDAEVSFFVWVTLAYFLYLLIKDCGPQNIITDEEAKELLRNKNLTEK